ncbi:MAG: hypothetical protein ACREQ5_04725, partial [Candidatus Dormibacteria bacterium]
MSWTKRNEYIDGVDRPGGCSICRSDLRQALDGSKEYAYSTGVLIDFEGMFTICASCLEEACALVGWIGPDKATDLRKKNRELGQENFLLK